MLAAKTPDDDSTKLEADEAMSTIVRRGDGKGFHAWLEEVARASGTETPTQQDMEVVERQRP